MKYVLLAALLLLAGCALRGSLQSGREYVDPAARDAQCTTTDAGASAPYDRTISWTVRSCIVSIPLAILAGWILKSAWVAVGGVTSSVAAIVIVSSLDTLLDWVPWITGGAIVLALVLLAFWLYSRRKRGLPWLPALPRLRRPNGPR